MAAANESQGLKIAVAAFVSLSVVLAVTSYFLYSNYSQASARLTEAESKASQAQGTASQAVGNLAELRTRAGYANIEDFESLKSAIKKDEDKLTNEVAAIVAKVRAMTEQYKAAGGSDPKVTELEQAAEQIFANFRAEPNKTYASSLDRMRSLLETQASLTTAYAIDNLNLRSNLESSNQVNNAKIGESESARANAKQDLENVIRETESARQDLLRKVDELQTDYNTILTEYENFKTKTNQGSEEYEKQLGDFRNQLTFYKDLNAKTETVMDSPDGTISGVDYIHNEVRINLTRAMGVHPQMVFAVFDRNAPIPNDRPKAHIELTSVDNTGSRARIRPATRSGQSLQTTADLMDPIRVGDYIYSPAWDQNSPRRFALIGRIDMNRDGRDDRQDLIRLIQQAGGVIEYDLPPPEAGGRESGKITGRCYKYIVDERDPLNALDTKGSTVSSETDLGFMRQQSEAIREARSLGVSPIPIERLLDSLGYSPNMVIPGRVESFDKATSDALLRPRGVQRSDTPPAAPDANNGFNFP